MGRPLPRRTIDSEAHLLACCRYIELNPVRAGMVAAPGDYAWSSWRAQAEGAGDPLLSEHDLYRRLGAGPGERQAAYRALFDDALDAEFVEAVRAATNGGWALGGERFKQQIAEALGRRVTPVPVGRPPVARQDRRPGKLL